MDDGLLTRVREKLKACSFQDITELAFTFQVVEVAACVSIIVLKTNPELMNKACAVIKHRPLTDVLWFGVKKLFESYPTPQLERTLRNLVEEHKFQLAPVPDEIPERIDSWFKAPDLVRGALEDYAQHDERDLIAFMERVNIDTFPGMSHALWDALLSKGTKKLLLRQKTKQIISKMEGAIQTDDLGRWARNYLIALEDLPDWDETILLMTKKRFGIPKVEKNAVEGPFWKKVPLPIKERFYHWCIGLQIEDFFDGTRAQFWKQFYKSHHILDVKSILSGSGFMLRFNYFGVVEFKSTGHAAYVYPSKHFDELWDNSSHKNSAKEFKDMGKTLHHPYLKEGRILHSGDWQMTYGHAIRSLVQRTTR
ncbi:hypothetical protein [Desulfoluna limicola]|uniref:hypothetical protein n=1 Tax=Desulfoluna limicola TaxID=2810562 RepID=UPI001F1E377E|nr:hypothetical protein [Desulfoluna limicola]